MFQYLFHKWELLRQSSFDTIVLQVHPSSYWGPRYEKSCEENLNFMSDFFSGHALLHKLGEVWTNFYQNILPTLQALFCSIPMKVREVTLLAFRDTVLLKLKIEEALDINDHPIPKSIMQMFCILFQVSIWIDFSRPFSVLCSLLEKYYYVVS